MRRESFLVSGIGFERLLTASFTFGFFFLAHMGAPSGSETLGKNKQKTDAG